MKHRIVAAMLSYWRLRRQVAAQAKVIAGNDRKIAENAAAIADQVKALREMRGF